jgi:hypothetical protein
VSGFSLVPVVQLTAVLGGPPDDGGDGLAEMGVYQFTAKDKIPFIFPFHVIVITSSLRDTGPADGQVGCARALWHVLNQGFGFADRKILWTES